MRRWLLWIGGVVVALVVFVGVLALTGSRSDAPFAFLEGHKPVRDHREEDVHLRVQPARSRYYTFKADLAVLDEGVRAELLALGYKERYTDVDQLAFSQSIVKVLPGRRETTVLAVHFWNDARLIVRKDGQHLDKEKGWVTVHVQGERPEGQSLLDRLRAWLGL